MMLMLFRNKGYNFVAGQSFYSFNNMAQRSSCEIGDLLLGFVEENQVNG